MCLTVCLSLCETVWYVLHIKTQNCNSFYNSDLGEIANSVFPFLSQSMIPSPRSLTPSLFSPHQPPQPLLPPPWVSECTNRKFKFSQSSFELTFRSFLFYISQTVTFSILFLLDSYFLLFWGLLLSWAFCWGPTPCSYLFFSIVVIFIFVF